MATTFREGDAERVKRWGKEFLGAQEAGARRFNPPPGWPTPPAGWVAPPGWQPDPSWPDPPPGWRLWVEDRPALSPRAKDALLAMAGGIGIVLGALMPWVSFNSADVQVKPGAKAASVVLGLVVMGLGFALRAAPRPGRLAAGIAALCLSSLAGLLYVGFALIGLHGVPEPDSFGDMTNVTFAPNIGIVIAAAGCGAAFVAAIMSFHHRQD